MNENLSSSAQKVEKALHEFGILLQILEFKETTKTSQEAAKLIGCDLSQIAKTIIFKGKNSHKPVCVIASGVNRINEKKIQEYLGEPIEKATPDFVLEKTDFVIGGVPPIGHVTEMAIFIDEDLMKYNELWTAAGNPHAVFKLAPQELLAITKGRVISVTWVILKSSPTSLTITPYFVWEHGKLRLAVPCLLYANNGIHGTDG